MTEPDPTPYWTEDDDWTGFCLQIVPATGLPAPAGELRRQVCSRIETDAVLYDLVTVAPVPPAAHPGLPAGSSVPLAGTPIVPVHSVVSTLITAAMAPGHFFAPRGVFALVVVGDQDAGIDQARRHLAELPLLGRLRVQYYTHVVAADSRHGGLSAASVLSIADIVKAVIADYERHPDIALDEATFLGELVRLHQEGFVLPGLEPEVPPAPPPAAVTTTVTDVTTDPAAPVNAELPATPAEPMGPPPAEPPSPRGIAPEPAPAPRRELRAPVVQTGADIVQVRTGSRLRRTKGPSRTGADWIEELAGWAGAVSLAYLVFVPDGDTQPREVSKRRRSLAIELDQALSDVIGDTETGRPMAVAVEVLGATSPLRKHGVLRPAGSLTDSDLPKVSLEYFDIFETADSLLGEMQRSSQALAVRDVDVLSHHLVFLATTSLPNTANAESECARLLQHARITWVHIGRGEPSLTPLQRESPFGVHILTDKDDVVALFRRESKVLYRWRTAPTPAGADNVTDAGAQAPPPRARSRWWPKRGLTPPPG